MIQSRPYRLDGMGRLIKKNSNFLASVFMTESIIRAIIVEAYGGPTGGHYFCTKTLY